MSGGRNKKRRRGVPGQRLMLQTRMVKRKHSLMKCAKARSLAKKHLDVGQKVPVEVLYTYSTVEVMWQVGGDH